MSRDLKKHFGKVRGVLVIVLVLNWAVALAKILLGFLTKCESMSADGLHSLSDGASNIIGLIGIALSSQPVDKDHPYGHRKYETFFSLGIAALLVLVAINLIQQGLEHIVHPVTPIVDYKSFVVMVVTIAVNILVMKYEFRKGKALKSDLLVADSMHTKADIFTSFSVIVALVGIKAGYPIIDPIVTLLISLFIGYAAIEIIRDASRILCDTVVMDTRKIASIVMKVDGVSACHKIRTRGRPDDICVDLHVQVNSLMHIDEAHRICDVVEGAIKKNIPEVTDVIVHIEPKEKKKK